MTGKGGARRSGRVTMREVAERAGVSIMTVSRVLNGERVAANTRERVVVAVEALGYRPDVSARSLSGTQSYQLGFLYDHNLGSYISQYLIGAMQRCNELGYRLVIEACDYGETELDAVIGGLTRRYQLDGIIVPPPLCEYLPLLDALERYQVRYVRVGPGLELERSPYVGIDDAQAVFDMTERLIRAGHRRIGFIRGDRRQGVAAIRFDGFRRALAANGVALRREWVAQGDFSFGSGMAACDRILEAGEAVTVVFASNDDMACGALAAAHRRGLKVPDDLAIVGFDDTSLATSVWPPLTTVRQPINEMSLASVNCMIDSIRADRHAGSSLPQRRIVDYDLIARESCPLNEN